MPNTINIDLDALQALASCPFCGAGTTTIHENGKVWTGNGYGEPSSVSVRHWCEAVEGQPSRMIERIGRDRTSAIAAWNRRADTSESAQVKETAIPLTPTDGKERERK